MSDWGSVRSPQQVGTPIETRGGKQGTVIDVGEKVVKFVGADGKLDAAHINNVRPQPGSALEQPGQSGPVARPWGDVGKGDVGRVVEDRKGRRGVIYQVGRGGAIAARGADGNAFGIPPGQGRIVSSAGALRSSEISSETSDSWSGVEHAIRNAKPNTARPGNAYSPAQMQELVGRIHARHRALFEALGVGAPMVDAKLGGALAMADGQLLINPAMLAQESARLTQQGISTEQWVQAALHEEWLHAAQMEAEARVGRDWEKPYAEIWNDPGLDPKLREGATRSYTGFEQLSDAQKGAEVMRMVLSARWSGTITERVYRAVQSFVDYLRGLDPAAQQSAPFRETLARAEAVLHEAHWRAGGAAANASQSPVSSAAQGAREDGASESRSSLAGPKDGLRGSTLRASSTDTPANERQAEAIGTWWMDLAAQVPKLFQLERPSFARDLPTLLPRSCAPLPRPCLYRGSRYRPLGPHVAGGTRSRPDSAHREGGRRGSHRSLSARHQRGTHHRLFRAGAAGIGCVPSCLGLRTEQWVDRDPGHRHHTAWQFAAYT